MQVFEPESHVPICVQSPPLAPSVISYAKAFGTNRTPSRKIPKNTGKNVFLVTFYFDDRTNKSDHDNFL